jgi:hypothetical protein
MTFLFIICFLKDITSVPDKFPGLRTDGILWIKDLSE